MAHSIENRVPFLDNELVQGSFDIPEKFLLMFQSPEGINTEKYLLKKTLSDKFGNDFAFRDKMGFSIPLKEFFSNNLFLEYLHDKVLPGIRFRGIFNYNLIVNWLHKLPFVSSGEFESLWIAIAFEIWALTFIDLKNENWNTSY
jgi:asparagine synthase (glutamine-hydrolysing)